MAIEESYTGSVSISTTEYSLANSSTTLTPITIAGVYQVFIDASNMAAGDEYRIKILEKVRSAGTQRTIYTVTLDGVQTTPFVTPSLVLMHGWDVTMQKLAGTDRGIAWSIRRVS